MHRLVVITTPVGMVVVVRTPLLSYLNLCIPPPHPRPVRTPRTVIDDRLDTSGKKVKKKNNHQSYFPVDGLKYQYPSDDDDALGRTVLFVISSAA